ncbi:helicase family protein [Actinobacteria bacterium IMCC26256]|nr:helicase family protein [Actinobacteria bacterium IMCC26256]
MTSSNHIDNREVIVDALRAELVGPDPQGPEVECRGSASIHVDDPRAPHRQSGSGEEILTGDAPLTRYGIGVLFPIAVSDDPPPENEEDGSMETPDQGSEEEALEAFIDEGGQEIEKVMDRFERGNSRGEGPDEEPSLAGANDRQPSAMAVSFLLDVTDVDELNVEITGGRYTARKVNHDPTSKAWQPTWWLRTPVKIVSTFEIQTLLAAKGKRISGTVVLDEGSGPISIEAFCVARAHAPNQLLLTVGIINRSVQVTGDDRINDWRTASCLFQSAFTVSPGVGSSSSVLPYPQRGGLERDDEEWSLELLYRDVQTFAIGHGCSADWDTRDGASRANAVRAECLPAFETPSITPNVTGPDGQPIFVPMAPLAGLIPEDNGMGNVAQIINGYEEWIDSKRDSISELEPEELKLHARRHIKECERMLSRMRKGVEFLEGDAKARRAFQLANRAILFQQIRAGAPVRLLEWDKRDKKIGHKDPMLTPDPLVPTAGRGQWRPFQIAFLLAAIETTALPLHEDRELVDLIFFPTGGGKTEAYLALAAFATFYRRLSDPEDLGTNVLMRYTLRLLTAQQFQRAAALICAMEIIRQTEDDKLGGHFSIGIWVGNSVTPNDKAAALKMLSELNKGDGYADNGFLVTRCPWCAAQIGPINYQGKKPKYAPVQVGYEQKVDTVIIKCTDHECAFSGGLPVRVIDQEIYEHRPDIIIGTVDKFARLIWRDDTRSIFGIGQNGEREYSPPGLIIQDELHLISGPLGSMVGMFETLIDVLCCQEHESGEVTRPKIVSSTATIRRYSEQTKALFARDDVALFPPRGLEAGDSYFATYARDASGELSVGRRYVGILGTSLGSHQTAQTRSAATALYVANLLGGPEAADPWWTVLSFYNSLRELGGGLSLYQRDIKEYMWTLHLRKGLPNTSLRSFHRVEELTSRIRNQDVPDRLAQLEVSTTDPNQEAIDACLATSIIEVGVDIDRLSLMAIIGQPKTTAQYIQVSGRVGRRWQERPGLILTVYSPTKARDRSHFEKFRSYHERLYAQVEPTSVTPFAPPVQERGLHALLVAFIRQFGPTADVQSPYPVPIALINRAKEAIEARVNIVDPDESRTALEMLQRRIKEWQRSGATKWQREGSVDVDFLIRPSGEYIEAKLARTTWALPTSLRDVDASCEATITSHYSAHLPNTP